LKNEKGAEFDGLPSGTMFDGIDLYGWCVNQRLSYIKFKAGTTPCGGMNEERAAQLEALQWNYIVGREDAKRLRKDDSWTARCRKVAELKNEKGAEFDGIEKSIVFDGTNLRQWCNLQRQYYKNYQAGTTPCWGMNEERAGLLEALEWNYIVGRDDEM